MNDEIYSQQIQDLVEGKIALATITEELKHSEDLQSDVTQFLQAIDKRDDFDAQSILSSLQELLRMIQQECIDKNPVREPISQNLHPYVAFANLFAKPGRAIVQNELRAFELLQHALNLLPNYPFALASLAGLFLEGGPSLVRDPKKAYSLLLEAVRESPDYSYALARLGELLRLGQGDVKADEALAYHFLQRSVDADPNNAFALGSLGALLKTGGRDMKRAHKYLSRAYELERRSAFDTMHHARHPVREMLGAPDALERRFAVAVE